MIIMICRECGKRFPSFPHPIRKTTVKTCPGCRRTDPYREWSGFSHEDSYKGILWQADIKLEQIQEPLREDATRPWKWDFSGSEFGAGWSGRIVIWSADEIKKDDVVDIDIITTTYNVWLLHETKVSMGGSSRAGGLVYYTEVKRVAFPSGGQPAKKDAIPGIEAHRYLKISKSQSITPPRWRLVTASVCYKTTLKGLGAQWHEELHIPNGTITLASASGRVRSGRLGGEMKVLLLPVSTTATLIRSGHGGGRHAPIHVEREI